MWCLKMVVVNESQFFFIYVITILQVWRNINTIRLFKNYHYNFISPSFIPLFENCHYMHTSLTVGTYTWEVYKLAWTRKR